MVMDPSHQHRLDDLQQHRRRRQKDVTLSSFIQKFQREVDKPYRQLERIIPIWRELVPPELDEHTRLESFQRGVLRVSVDSSAHLYELDRLLREGLENQLITSVKGAPLRKVHLRLG